MLQTPAQTPDEQVLHGTHATQKSENQHLLLDAAAQKKKMELHGGITAQGQQHKRCAKSKIKDLVGDTLLKSSHRVSSMLQEKGETAATTKQHTDTQENLSRFKLIAFYFGSANCGHCREFTPMLMNVYNEIKKKDSNLLEIIYVPCDDDQEAFNENYKGFPWLSMPFHAPEKAKLFERFHVEYTPTLVVLDSYGNLLDHNASSHVKDQGVGALEKWQQLAAQHRTGKSPISKKFVGESGDKLMIDKEPPGAETPEEERAPAEDVIVHLKTKQQWQQEQGQGQQQQQQQQTDKGAMADVAMTNEEFYEKQARDIHGIHEHVCERELFDRRVPALAATTTSYPNTTQPRAIGFQHALIDSNDPHIISSEHCNAMIDNIVQSAPVVVLSSKSCEYSNKAKQLLGQYPLNIRIVEIEDLEARCTSKNAVRNYIEKITGARTTPRIFIGGKFMGGFDAIAQMEKENTLKPQLRSARALQQQ